MAARLGAEVTALDCAPEMLDRLSASRQRAGVPMEVVLGDLFSHKPSGAGYDCIAAHFVLDAFALPDVEEALDRFTAQLRPGGRLVIADFAVARNLAGRAWIGAYYGLLELVAWSMGLAALHGVYDFEALLRPRGWGLGRRVRFGPYESLTFVDEAQRSRSSAASAARPVSSSSTA